MGLELLSPVEIRSSQELPFWEELVVAYKSAFAGYPWFEDLSLDEVQKRIKNNLETPGFEGIWLVDKSQNKLVAATWWTTPTVEKLRQERGAEFGNFVEQKLYEYGNRIRVIWINETLVSHDYQKLGVATHLKSLADLSLTNKASDLKLPLLVTTRMRDDNFGIIKINENLGMKRTGVRVPASQKPGMFHEFWYKIIEPKNE